MSKTPDPYPVTDKEKIPALGAALYEMQQFCNCVEVLRKGPDQVTENAFLESMLIHVRVLQDFFQKGTRRHRKGKELDDVLSKDFEFLPEPIPLRPDYESRIDKEVAHLTYSRARRITRAEKEWEPDAFLELVIRCIKFIEFIETHDQEILRDLEQFRAKHPIPALHPAQVKAELTKMRVSFEITAQRKSSSTGVSG